MPPIDPKSRSTPGSTRSAGNRAPRMSAAARRQQIIETALRVFARTDYAQAGTAGIAAEAGISEPTIYRHFESKQALYLAVIDHTRSEILGEWEQLRVAAGDPLTAISQIAAWYQAKIKDEPELLQQRFRSLTTTDVPEIREAVRESHRAIIRFIRGIFEDAIEDGRFPRGVDPRLPTALFMAMGALMDVLAHLDLQEELGLESSPEFMSRLGALFATLERRTV